MTWPTLTLGELTATTRPICYGVLKPGPYTQDGVPLLRIVDMAGDVVDQSGYHRISSALDSEFHRSRLRGGEVLLSIQGTVGRVAIAPMALAGANVSRTIAVIEPDSRLEPQFLRLYLMSRAAGSGFQTTGTTRASLNISVIRAMPVPVPPLDEQRRIVGLLDDHLSRLDAATAYLDAGRRRAALLLHSARESIWEVTQDRASIAELGEVITGKTPPTRDPANSGDEVPFVTPGDLAQGDVVGTVHRSISEHGARSSRTVEEGSVLAVCIGATLGKVGYTERRVAFNQQINAVRLSTVDEAQLLAAAMTAPSFQRKMREASSATTMPILNKSSFSRLLVPRVPSAAREGLLDRIRETSEAVEHLRNELNAGVSRSAALRRSLLAAAFAGRLTGAATEPSEAEEMINV